MFVPVLAGFSNSTINCHSKCHRSHTWPPFLSFFKHKSWSRKSWRLNGSTMVIMVLCHYADGAWWCLGWTSQPPSPSPQWAARNFGRDAVAKMLPAMADCSNIFRGIKNHENGEVHHVSLQQFSAIAPLIQMRQNRKLSATGSLGSLNHRRSSVAPSLPRLRWPPSVIGLDRIDVPGRSHRRWCKPHQRPRPKGWAETSWRAKVIPYWVSYKSAK